MEVTTVLTATSLLWIAMGVYGLTVASAIVPWINAEVIVLSLPTFAASPTGLLVLLLSATAGQMTGKCVVYSAGLKGGGVLPARAAGAVALWRVRLSARPAKAAALVLLSSLLGLPPFYVMSLVAGALRMNLALFLAVGTAGRLLRFGTLLWIPQIALPWFHRGTGG